MGAEPAVRVTLRDGRKPLRVCGWGPGAGAPECFGQEARPWEWRRRATAGASVPQLALPR
ncbi:predicted protein [Streptomyces viridochromogenes DSM 40736]|uniref:Predicted protein n=1 Tax=Streptomyces viridochromogenes (strain DSM 40736 / JCM 4977 / BCRC 1201 / Tue 494) TaxID=591159 RepID=D9X5L5_STRVT|nr:predicted protein [Streptomyces viridochromogenes DSM 40736]